MSMFSSSNRRLPNGVRRLLRLPPTGERLAEDAEEEVRIHLEMRAAELRELGLSAAEADAEARLRFGDVDHLRDEATRRARQRGRRIRWTEWMAAWMQDARYAVRQFSKAPAFTAVAVLTLALGIGANTAIFTVVHRLLLDPLPYPNGNRLVMPMQVNSRGVRTTANNALVRAWQERGKSIDRIAAAYNGEFSMRADAAVDSFTFARITANYLDVLGVEPALGRAFTPDEEGTEKNAATVAMISYGWWQRAYGGRPDAIGATIQINATSYTVVGVAPPGLGIPTLAEFKPDFWIPTSIRRREHATIAPQFFAVLRRGATAEMATRELETIARMLPNVREPRPGVRAMRAQDFLDGRQTRTVEVLFVAVGALLLIACANVANLLLARASTRRREFAVRTALGASRGRLTRQVLTESVMLALAGGALGVAVAWTTLRVIIALRPDSLQHLDTISLEPVVLVWSVAVSIVTGVLFGAAPALFAGRGTRIGDVLRNEGRAAAGGVFARRVRSTLIVLEIAMSLVLLIGAGLLVRSFVQMVRTPLGFEPRGLVSVTQLAGPARPPEAVAAIRQTVLDHVRALPGVSDVAIGFMPGVSMGGGLETDEGGRITRLSDVRTSPISSHYFRVARIALVDGRLPDSLSATMGRDVVGTLSREVVVSRRLAQRLFPNGHAVGSRIRSVPRDSSNRDTPPWSVVVGIADDTRLPGIRSDWELLTVYSVEPAQSHIMPLLIRTAVPGTPTAPSIHHAIRSIDPMLVMEPAWTGESAVDASLAPTRFAMALLTAFAIVALVLSAVGLYAVIAYGVSQRTREIGIRVALGAEPRAVAGLVIGGGIRLTAIGLIVGLAAAAASTRALAKLLYDVAPTDPLTFVATIGLVASIALLASYLPARRAVRIDPTEALRAD